jgi:hypothetical protein
MTGQQAVVLLQKPIFGDEDCIRAVAVYGRLALLKALRQEWADEQGLAELADIYDQDPPPIPEALTAGQIEAEIDYWEIAEERCL